ncbi:MAG: porin PorA family protein [Candidatus Poseidoniales archaeon]
MSDMNKPEMTAQVLVAVGAVFLLISAYVMGVYIPNQKELDDDFESRTSFDGDMTLFDATKSATLQGDFNPENALNSYAANDGTNAEIVAKADPALSDDDKTYYNFNASAFTSKNMTEENRILTFTDYNNYVDRTTWETKDADDPDDTFGYSLWNPNELPEKKNTQYPNPFVSSHTNTYIYAGEEKVGGIDCYKYTADETFEYSSESILALKANFDGFLPAGVEGTSYGEMQYKEVIWVSTETGQVADRELDILVNFIPDPRLAVLFQATEALDSVIVYEGTLDGADITADRRTFSSGSIFTGTDNATGAERTYMNATGTLLISGETEPRVNSTFLIDTHTQQAQVQAPDGTYISAGSTFFSIGSVCENSTVDNFTTYNYPNLFLTTHVNTYECVETTAIPGFIIPSANVVGNTSVYHYRSVETDVSFGNLDQDGDGVDDTPNLPVFDPVNGFCMNPAVCADRQWSNLIAYALTQTSLGQDALQIPIKSDSTMDLPRLGTEQMVLDGDAMLGGSFHPLIQGSFVAINDYAADLGVTNEDGSPLTYDGMPFVLNKTHPALALGDVAVPGTMEAMIAGQAQLGSQFHPTVFAGIAGKVSFLGINQTAAAGMPWMISGNVSVGEEENVTNVMVMPLSAFPEMDMAAELPVLEEQTLPLFMDYEENVMLDPVTATVLDQDFNIVVSIHFPWGTETIVQAINVAYTDNQTWSSSASRWTAEFGYTFIPGSPVRADNANFTIMTLKGGYSDAEVADAKKTIEDTSSSLSSARTIPMVLIGVALVSLMGGFYVYYQNNQGEGMTSGMDDSSSEESAPSMAVTEESEEETEKESADSEEE